MAAPTSIYAFLNQTLRVRQIAGDVSGATPVGLKYWNPDESASGFTEGALSGTEMIISTVPSGVLSVEGWWKLKTRALFGADEYLGRMVRLRVYGRAE